MQDADLFMELAGIAGVFVGFGALISIRGGGASGNLEVGMLRGTVSFGALTIVAALAPVTLGHYGVTEHGTWALSSVLVLIGNVAMLAAMARTPEYRANRGAGYGGSRWLALVDLLAMALWVLATFLGPIVIVLGVVPDLEAALYFTAVVVLLFEAALVLLTLVYAGQDSGRVADEVAQLTAGGASA
jgi:hypothetical protein